MGLHKGSIFEVKGTIIFIVVIFFFSFFEDDTLLKAVAIALNDFSSFDQMSPVAYLLEVGDHNSVSLSVAASVSFVWSVMWRRSIFVSITYSFSGRLIRRSFK